MTTASRPSRYDPAFACWLACLLRLVAGHMESEGASSLAVAQRVRTWAKGAVR